MLRPPPPPPYTFWPVPKGDVTRNDSQRRFLAQHSVEMVEQCCKHSKQCRKNVGMLRCIIVVTLFRMVVTLFQYCIAVLRKKSSLRIVPFNITFKLPTVTTKAKASTQKSFTGRTLYKWTPSGKWFLDPYLMIESCEPVLTCLTSEYMDKILCSRHSNETTSSFGSTVMFFYIQ